MAKKSDSSRNSRKQKRFGKRKASASASKRKVQAAQQRSNPQNQQAQVYQPVQNTAYPGNPQNPQGTVQAQPNPYGQQYNPQLQQSQQTYQLQSQQYQPNPYAQQGQQYNPQLQQYQPNPYGQQYNPQLQQPQQVPYGQPQVQQGTYSQQPQNPGYVNAQAVNTPTAAQKRARIRRAKELKRRRRNRRITIAVIFLLLLIGAFILIRNLSGSSSLVPEDELDMADQDDDEEEENYTGDPICTILFAGDISTSADQIESVTRADNTYDFSIPFRNISTYIEASDYAVADFATTMVDNTAYGLSPYYNSPVQLAGTLRDMGFRLMSTANMHMLDNGIEGEESTINYLTEARLKHVGTYTSQEERDKNGGAYIRTIHGIKFAFLAYTKGTESVSIPDGCEYALNTLYTDYSDYWSDLRTDQIESDIQAAKDAGAEVIIALLHWGSEYSRSITPSQEEAAELLLSNGVDVIIGTHSHLVNEMGFVTTEQSDGTNHTAFVAYGLGDLYTDPEKDTACTSVLLNLTFSRDGLGSITITPQYIPIYQYISKTDTAKTFEIMDTYSTLAALGRLESMNYLEASLYNNLLDSIDTLHTYAPEEYDRGPSTEDTEVVQEAIDGGQLSSETIRKLREAQEEDEENRAKQIAKANKAVGVVDSSNETDTEVENTDEQSAEDSEEEDSTVEELTPEEIEGLEE